MRTQQAEAQLKQQAQPPPPQQQQQPPPPAAAVPPQVESPASASMKGEASTVSAPAPAAPVADFDVERERAVQRMQARVWRSNCTPPHPSRPTCVPTPRLPSMLFLLCPVSSCPLMPSHVFSCPLMPSQPSHA